MLQTILNVIQQFWTCINETTIVNTTFNNVNYNITIGGLLIAIFTISISISFVHIVIVGSHSEGDKS